LLFVIINLLSHKGLRHRIHAGN